MLPAFQGLAADAGSNDMLPSSSGRDHKSSLFGSLQNFLVRVFFDTPDPYVRLTLMHASGYRKGLRTKAIKAVKDMGFKLHDVHFGDEDGKMLFFTLPKSIDLRVPEQRRFMLRIEVYDEDFGKDDLIGQASKSFLMNDTIIDQQQNWKLQSLQGEYSGSLKFSIGFGTRSQYGRETQFNGKQEAQRTSESPGGESLETLKASIGEDEKLGVVVNIETACELTNPNMSIMEGHDTFLTSIALLLVIVYFLLGGFFYSIHEKWSPVNSVYFAVVTITTTGYGDLLPSTNVSKLFTCFYAFLGIGVVTSALGILGGYVLEENRKLMSETLNIQKLVQQDQQKLAGHSSLIVGNKIREAMGAQLAVVYKFSRRYFLIVLILSLIIIGAIFFHYQEPLGWVDAFYLSCISLATVGYGDLSPKTEESRIFTIIWLTLGTVIIARAIADCLKTVMEYRQKKLTLTQFDNGKLSARDFEVFDEDGDGVVTRCEFLARMLVKMKKVEMQDIRIILRMFESMDIHQTGVLIVDDYVQEDEQVNDDYDTPLSTLPGSPAPARRSLSASHSPGPHTSGDSGEGGSGNGRTEVSEPPADDIGDNGEPVTLKQRLFERQVSVRPADNDFSGSSRASAFGSEGISPT